MKPKKAEVVFRAGTAGLGHCGEMRNGKVHLFTPKDVLSWRKEEQKLLGLINSLETDLFTAIYIMIENSSETEVPVKFLKHILGDRTPAFGKKIDLALSRLKEKNFIVEETKGKVSISSDWELSDTKLERYEGFADKMKYVTGWDRSAKNGFTLGDGKKFS